MTVHRGGTLALAGILLSFAATADPFNPYVTPAERVPAAPAAPAGPLPGMLPNLGLPPVASTPAAPPLTIVQPPLPPPGFDQRELADITVVVVVGGVARLRSLRHSYAINNGDSINVAGVMYKARIGDGVVELHSTSRNAVVFAGRAGTGLVQESRRFGGGEPPPLPPPR